MDMILSILGAITVVLLGAHLYDYLTTQLNRPFARYEEPTSTVRSEAVAGARAFESELPYDRAA